MPLRDHLRADQDIDFAFRERAQHLLEFALGADGVAIETRDARGREIARGDIPRRARRRHRRNTYIRRGISGIASAGESNSRSSGIPGAGGFCDR